MKKVNSFALYFLLVFSSFSLKANGLDAPLTDKVSLTFSAQHWVKTETANVDVDINATLTHNSLLQVRKQILTNLNNIVKGDWHITQFKRNQNSSGLETLYVSASARVKQSSIALISEKAKKVSAPGIQYKIANIDFSPSAQDENKIEALVRQELYQQINKELSLLNNEYKGQNYSLYSASFYKQADKERLAHQSLRNAAVFSTSNHAASTLPVSNQLILYARVILASNRTVEVK